MSSSIEIEIRNEEMFSEFIELKRRLVRNRLSSTTEQVVQGIISRVSNQGDKALIEYTRWFDKIELTQVQLRIPKEELKAAYARVSEQEISALKEMMSRIRRVAERTLEGLEFSLDIEGTKISSTVRPLAEIGCYVPGGSAAYPSSLIMCTVPAVVAGVKRIVVCTPPKEDGVNPLTLVAADLCGIEEVYQVGGAQAIAALSIGTQTIRPVQKIVGPGNAFVALAKRMVSNQTLIDMPAGPSELMVIADETASPRNIALDLISQAEHSNDTISILVSPSEKLCSNVTIQLTELIPESSRKDTVCESFKQNGGVYICDTLEKCIDLVNEFAPEHVEIMTTNAREVASQITSAGLILLGDYTPVAASDYCLGTNHVLPTEGYASIYSGLSVLDFIRIVRIAETSKTALIGISDTVCTLAQAEGLLNHARAIRGRFEE
ncbi:MAG: histidinol dehydrogenase [Candidatus Thorarchaeota archaeon]